MPKPNQKRVRKFNSHVTAEWLDQQRRRHAARVAYARTPAVDPCEFGIRDKRQVPQV